MCFYRLCDKFIPAANPSWPAGDLREATQYPQHMHSSKAATFQKNFGICFILGPLKPTLTDSKTNGEGTRGNQTKIKTKVPLPAPGQVRGLYPGVSVFGSPL